jgi:hypothetical protein
MESVDDATWRKASYSSGNGAACVEIATWRKASYSSDNGGACVEIGSTTARGVAVRDTTDRDGVTLTLPAPAWRAFLHTLR